MYSDLLPELQREICKHFNPCEQVRLMQIDRTSRDMVESQSNYDQTARTYGLPRFYGDSPLRHLCHYYNVLQSGDNHNAVIEAAIQGKDTEWLLSEGIRLASGSDNMSLIVMYLAETNNLEAFKAIDYDLTNSDIANVLSLCMEHGHLELYLYIVESYNPIQNFDIAMIAADGYEDMVNYFDNTANRCDILAGYLIGRHYKLHTKYSKIYGEKECFKKPHIQACIKHGNLEVLKLLISGDVRVYMVQLVLSKADNIATIFQAVRHKMPPTEFSNQNYVFMIAKYGNYRLLEAYIPYITDAAKRALSTEVIHSNFWHMSSYNKIRNNEDYRKSLSLLLDYLEGQGYPESYNMLAGYAEDSANLELIELVEQL